MDAQRARRKLEFRGKPFRSKLFYVNVKNNAVRQRVEDYIRDLGGSIETFLTNDIHLFISDCRTPTKRKNTLIAGVAHCEAVNEKQGLPLSRGRALLLKARKNANETLASEVNAVTDIQDKAAEMGMKIEHVHTFLKRCKALAASNAIRLKKHDSFSDITPLKWDDKCFLKVEDDECIYKPLFKRFENLPQLFPENGRGSPFDGPVVLQKPSCTESSAKVGRKTSRFSHNRGGYCEMCQCLFTNSLKQHMVCQSHQQYVRNKENFKKIDKIIKKLPSLNRFLFKYIPAKRSSRVPCSQPADDSSPETSTFAEDVHSFSENKIDSNMSGDNISERVVYDKVCDNKVCDNNVCENTVYDMVCDDLVLKDEINTLTTQQPCLSSNQDLANNVVPPQLFDTSVPPWIDTILCNIPEVNNHDSLDNVDPPFPNDVFGNSSRLTRTMDIYPASLGNTVTTFDMKTLPVSESISPKKRSKPTPNLQFTASDCHSLSELLYDNQDEPIMFSELSESDSQTNALKNLIDNLSLRNDLPAPNATCTESSVVSAYDHVLGTRDVAAPATCASDATTATTTPITIVGDPCVETPMSLGTPFSVSSVPPTPWATHHNGSIDTRKSKKKSRKTGYSKNGSMYCSHKTSDMKLRLCRIVLTPVNQKSNLKMFWKVRKTGDCRLVFSAEKRKRSGSSGDHSIHDNSDRVTNPVGGMGSGHRNKRQRLAF